MNENDRASFRSGLLLLFAAACAVVLSCCCWFGPEPESEPEPAPLHGTFMTGAPLMFVATGTKDFHVEGAGYFTACEPDAVDFDRFHDDVFPDTITASPLLAVSLGQENFHVQPPTGDPTTQEIELIVPPGLSWTAVLFTVDDAAVSAGDEALADVVDADLGADPSPVAATVYVYLLPQSDGAPPLGITHRSMSPLTTELLDVGDRIGAFDMHAALHCDEMLTGPGSSFFVNPLDDHPAVYFTVRPEVVDDLVGAGWSPGATKSPHGIVFRSSWIPASDNEPGHWSPAEVWFDLGKELQFQTGDGRRIDALSIHIRPDPAGGADIEDVMFSEGAEVAIDDQLRFLRKSGPALPGVRRVVVDVSTAEDATRKFEPLGRRIGAGSGLGDTCSEDPALEWATRGKTPALATSGAGHVWSDFFIARRHAPAPGTAGARRLEAAGFRRVRDGGHEFVTNVDCGRGGPARATVEFGTVEWFFGKLDFAATGGPYHIKWDPGATQVIDFDGTPRTAVHQIPSRFGDPAVARGAVLARWRYDFEDGSTQHSHIVVLRQ